MDIEIFTLCDAAADYSGRLNILGVFDTIFATQVPAMHPLLSVVFRARFKRIEAGAHPVMLHVVDDDGGMVVPPLEGRLDVQMPAGLQVASANLVFNFGNVQFSKFGEYAINIAIDNQEVGSLPFWVKKHPST